MHYDNQWEERWEEPLVGCGLSEDQWEKRWEEPKNSYIKLSLINTIKQHRSLKL
jgi:hypothetical protein